MTKPRINIGCGKAPTVGWLNYDNSPAIWMARSPMLVRLLRVLGFLDKGNLSYIAFCHEHGIMYANATRRIPHPDGSVGAIYSSHMIEHLDRVEARMFLQECRRVLASGGILRLAAPDLLPLARSYVSGEYSADGFLTACVLELDKPRGFAARMRHAIFAGREHHWMYDGKSLAALMSDNGFIDIRVLDVGQTTISDPGSLDLREREEESVYVEGRRS